MEKVQLEELLALLLLHLPLLERGGELLLLLGEVERLGLAEDCPTHSLIQSQASLK